MLHYCQVFLLEKRAFKRPFDTLPNGQSGVNVLCLHRRHPTPFWENEQQTAPGTSVSSAFVSAPGNVFRSRTPSQTSDYGRVGLGLTKGLGANRSLALRGDMLVAHNRYDEHSFEVRFRQAF